MSNLPEVTQESIIHVDATPDKDYPLRILKAYRQNCNVRWVQVAGKPSAAMEIMNEHCEQRAAILDKAIKLLELNKIEIKVMAKQGPSFNDNYLAS